MLLKRKRSDSEISTSSSMFSSPPSAPNFTSMDYQSHQSQIPTPSLFASRTRKRYRDNRPSESEVHRMPCLFLSVDWQALIPSTEHTLSLLYSAQQKPQQSSLPTSFRSSQSHEPVSSLPSSSQNSQQSSLHSFWHGPMASSTRQSSPSSNYSASPANTPGASPPHMTSMFSATNCEDCDASLGQSDNGDSMDLDMMDVDMGTESHACTSCGKQVCHSCSVSNLGAERKCLNCAGRRTHGAFGFVNR